MLKRKKVHYLNLGTDYELKITEDDTDVIIETKEDLRKKELRKEQMEYLLNVGILMLNSFAAGLMVMYLILN